MPQSTVVLSAADWERFRASAARDSGGVLPLPGSTPELFSSVDITVMVDGNQVASFAGQVVNVFGDSVALMFDPAARGAIVAEPKPLSPGAQRRAEVRRRASASNSGAREAFRPGASASHSGEHRPVERSDSISGSAPAADNPEEATRPGTRHEGPVWKRYAEMTRPEKIKLARTGNEAERRAVLKDRDSSIHHFVLNNPNMKPKELAALIRGGGVSGPFIKKLCERHDLVNARGIKEALVVNPLTPTDVAVRLVAKVPIDLARRIARSSTYKPQVVNAAKKRVIAP